MIAANAGSFREGCVPCGVKMGWQLYEFHSMVCPRKQIRKHCKCERPKWTFNDDGHGWCQTCNRPERRRRLIELTDWEERRAMHYSNYTGWDPGFGPYPIPPKSQDGPL